MQDFVNAADCYEQLSVTYPEVEDYKLYYSQALYKACLYDEAMKVSCQIDNPNYQGKVRLWYTNSTMIHCLYFYSTIWFVVTHHVYQ